jgi:hypothetical protein
MEFKDVAAVSGKPGLFKIIKPTRTGVILESIDAAKNKVIIDSNSKVSILKDITVYTNGDDNIALSEILVKMNDLYKGTLPVSSKNSDKELKDFLLKIVADYDTERVYASDIRKMLNWYTILHANYPELLVKSTEEPSAEVVEDDKAKKAVTGKAGDGKKPAANKVKDIKPKQVSTKTSAPPKKITAARKAS